MGVCCFFTDYNSILVLVSLPVDKMWWDPPVTDLPLLSESNQSRANPDFLRFSCLNPSPNPAKDSFSCPPTGTPHRPLWWAFSLGATRNKPACSTVDVLLVDFGWRVLIELGHKDDCDVDLWISFDSLGESTLRNSSNSSTNLRTCVNFRWFFPISL